MSIPSRLDGFSNSDTSIQRSLSGREVLCFNGTLDLTEADRVCSLCGSRMHINGHLNPTLRHLCFGGSLTAISFDRVQLVCRCGHSHMQSVPFKAEGHQISVELYQYARDLLALGTYTLKQVAEITGLGRNTVKDIDLVRLKERYTIDGTKLIKPERQATMLAIDEFKLHNGHRYATHIIDLDTGHILWISHGKKKQVVYDFIEHVGLKWMDSVEAIACDMNSDFQEAFEEGLPCGEYLLRETQTLSNLILSEKEYRFSVTPEQTDIEIEAENSPYTGTVRATAKTLIGNEIMIRMKPIGFFMNSSFKTKSLLPYALKDCILACDTV